MVHLKRLGSLVIVIALTLPAYADRGNTAYKLGVREERQTNFDEAYKHYKEANALTPNNPTYFVAYTRMRSKAQAQHLHKGQLLRSTGALQNALVEFQRAAEIDSSDSFAQQEVRTTTEMIRQQEKPHTAPKIESPLSKMAADIGEPVSLRPISGGPITLKMVANADAVYRAIAKLAGINVLLDPDYRPPKVTIDLDNVTLLEALDMLSLQAKAFWRPVLANTIFVTASTAAKRKELEQNVMKTFYLQNVSAPTDLQEAATMVTKMLDVNRVQLLQSQDALVVRGTMDQMVLVQKLLTDIDKPKSEVVIDVMVMEVNRGRIRTLGAVLPTTASVAYLPSQGTGVAAAPTFSVGSFGFNVGGGTFTALATESNGKVLQNPRIRVLNDQKATLRIGDRVPIATGSFASTVGSVSPLVSTQFQYLDVGVNIDITPHIHSDRQVTLKMSLEISTVASETSIGGITEPVIGQRRIEHETQLADGEVNLLAGILTDTETQSLSGYPLINKIPILKYLFGQDTRDHEQNEIVFAITPHIVRAIDITEENDRLVDVGTGSTTELRRKPASAPVPPAEHPAAPAVPPAARVPAPVPSPVKRSAISGAPVTALSASTAQP